MRYKRYVLVATLVVVGGACGEETPAPSGGQSCPGAQALCGEACADLTRDEEHCGACDVACDAGQICESGECVPVCPASQELCDDGCKDVHSDPLHCGACDAPCDVGLVCSNGTCALSCVGGQIVCDGRCVDPQVSNAYCGASADCLGTNAGESCAPGHVCNTGACGLSCAAGQIICGGQCTDPMTSNAYCGASADCQGLDAGESCDPGYLCSSGACGLSCAAGQIICDGQCTDPQTSNAHCGASADCQGVNAGESCAPGYVCSSGACDLSCVAGQIICGGECTDPTTSSAYCGASADCQGLNAGESCASGYSCVGGSCLLSCPVDQLACGGLCVDPQTDNVHCGASGDCQGGDAGQACGLGELCVSGVCELSCPSGQLGCSGLCVNPQTDNQFCGASGDCQGGNAGQTCGSGQVCSSGACAVTCTPGTVECDGGCFDLSSSTSHCGGCGNPCAGGEACFGGSCVFLGCDWDAAFESGLPILPDPVGYADFGPSCEMYVSSPYTRTIWKFDFNSTSPSNFYAFPGPDYIYSLAFHPGKGHLYIATADLPSALVWAVAPGGGSVTNLNVAGIPSTPNMTRVAPPGWGSHGGELVMGFIDGTVWLIDVDTSAATLLTTLSGDVSGLAFDGDTLYATDFDASLLVTISPTGIVTPFANMPCQTSGLEADPGNRLFVSCGFGSGFYEVTLPGGSVSLLFTPPGGSVGSYPRLMKWDGVNSLIYGVEPFHLYAIDI